jgi:hypothetical protein
MGAQMVGLNMNRKVHLLQFRQKGGYEMKLNAPQKITWWIALIVGMIGIVAHLVTIPVLSGLAFWLVAVAFVLLILATYLKGL